MYIVFFFSIIYESCQLIDIMRKVSMASTEAVVLFTYETICKRPII